MLNEIFKGMDNAAEQINENFEAVEMKRGKNESGEYVKYANGWLITHQELTLYGSNWGDGYIDLPAEFDGKASVIISAADNNATWMNFLRNNVSGYVSLGKRLRIITGTDTPSYEIRIVVTCLGFSA